MKQDSDALPNKFLLGQKTFGNPRASD